MKLTTYTDPASFERASHAFLSAREAENNLFIGLTATLIERPNAYGSSAPYFALVHDDAGAVKLAALRTPPHNLLISAGSDPAALAMLAVDVQNRFGSLSGVSGPVVTADAFVDLWQRATGERPVARRSERIYQLDAVVRPRPVPGLLVKATAADRELLVEWMYSFAAEALGVRDRKRAESGVELRLTSRSASLHLWIDGEPVCMAGAGGPTPTGIRVGPVYTPPARRRSGYASACVAALSQSFLDSGRRRCFLFTDLGNQTSNSIYQAIGYRSVCDVLDIEFGRG